MGAWVYIIRCADGSYYVGNTRKRVEQRTAQPDDEYMEHIDPTDVQEGDPEVGDED